MVLLIDKWVSLPCLMLSNAKAEAANFPFCTIEPNVGVITVPDERLKVLNELVNPRKLSLLQWNLLILQDLSRQVKEKDWVINFVNIREVDAIIHVVRCFDNENIVHVEGVLTNI